MIKTQIQLEEDQYVRLKRLSRQEARSIADLVRQSVGLLLRQVDARSLPPLTELAGKYRPAAGVDLKPHDASWARAIR